MKKRIRQTAAAALAIIMVCTNLSVTAYADTNKNESSFKKAEITRATDNNTVHETTDAAKEDVAAENTTAVEEENGKTDSSDHQKATESNSATETISPETAMNDIIGQPMNIETREATPPDAVPVYTEDGLRNAVRHSGTVVIEGSIALTHTLRIEGDIDLELRGGELTFSGNREQWAMIEIRNDARLTLENITIDGTGMDYDGIRPIDGGSKDYYVISADGEDGEWKGADSLVINDGTVIKNSGTEMENDNFRGVWFGCNSEMNGGIITGFPTHAGVIGEGATLTINDGQITNSGGLAVLTGEGGEKSTLILKGGVINRNSSGIFNQARFIMEGGEITENGGGVLNSNEDELSHEQFTPEAELKGGTIAGNRDYGVVNCKERGTLIIDGVYITDTVEGADSNMSLFDLSQRNDLPFPLISNETGATLEIKDGRIVSNAPNGIAVYNDDKSKLTMTGGTIAVNGAGSVVIQNDNPQKDSVVLQGGSTVLGADSSTVVAGSGNTTVGDSFTVDAGDRVQIKGISAGNGWVDPTLTYANIGDTINFTIKANPGYRVSDVKVNGVSVGAVSQYALTVTGADVLEAQFVYVSSSGGSSHSGGSGGSGGSFASSSATKPSIPETPGAWVQDQTGWEFASPNQIPYVNTWIRSKNQWYWVGEDGYMKTGWNQIAEKWYYLTPVTGEMKTGWLQDGGFWYYLDETGARKTGWIQDGTKWYYLNQDGTMAANTVTPDGYKVDGSGAWVQ